MTGSARALAVCALVAVSIASTASADVLKEGLFEVRFEPADAALANRALAVLSEAQREFEDRLPAGEAPVRVAVCHTTDEFAKYAGRYSQPSVEGVARPSEGVIAIKSPVLVRKGYDPEGALRHELVHVLLVRNINADYLPRWLNEGVAMMLAKEHRWESGFHVARMYFRGHLIPYSHLGLAFLEPGREMAFGDAYAQSLSMTRFLLDELGEEEFWQLMHALDTTTFRTALKEHAGMTPGELWLAWEGSLWKVALIFSVVSGFSLFQVMALLTIAAYWRKRRKGRRLLRQWEEEDEEPPLLLASELEGREPEYGWEPDEDEED